MSLKFVSPGPLQGYCPALSSRVNLKDWFRQLLNTSVPCRQSDLGIQYHPWYKIHSGRPPHFIQWVKLWRIKPLESQSRVWGFWFIPPLLDVTYLQPTSFMGGFSPYYTWGKHGLIFYRAISFGLVPKIR